MKFSRIRSLSIGTMVYFTDISGVVYSYEISDVQILNPDQTEEMIQETDAWDLSVFTCTFDDSQRYTIRCIRSDR